MRRSTPSEAHIDAQEDKLAHATLEQRELISNASKILRRARAVGQVDVVIRRPNEDYAAPLTHADDRRHAVDVLGQTLDV